MNQRNSGGKAPFYPAVSLVLNFGPHRWSVPKTLRDCFQDLPPELEPFIPDYRLHVIDVAFLSREEVEGLKSDMYHVADYLTQTRQTGDYHAKEKRRIVHVDETLKLMNAITKNDSFLKSVEAMGPEEKEKITMDDVLARIVERGRNEMREENNSLRQKLEIAESKILLLQKKLEELEQNNMRT